MDPESSQPASKGSPDGEASTPAELTINLKIISPSLTLPVSLLGLPATTTVLQVKERVRQKLQSRPSDAQQRLIYRGRMLNRPEEKLLDLFGEEMIRTSDQQTIHLILPEQVESPSLSSTTTPVRGQSPARQEAINNAHHQYFDSVLQQGARHLSRRTVTTTTTTVSSPAGTHTPTDPPSHPASTHPTAPQMYRTQHGPTYTAQSLQQMAQRLSREAARQRAHLHQYDRPGMGLAGLRYNNIPQAPGINTPDHGPYRRASPSPNAEGNRVGTAESGLSDTEVQNMFRAADTRQAIRTMTTAMQRSTSGASMGLPQSGRATPNHLSRNPSGNTIPGAFGSLHANPTIQAGTEVYILNSPNGPRGLLLNNHTETYYTPSMRPTATSSGSSYGLPNPQQLRQNFAFLPTTPTPTLPPQLGVNQDNQGDVDGQGRVRRRVRIHVNRGGNMNARQNHAGMVALIARFWPHFWLAVRLGLFVWWFTSPNSGWARWLAVIGIALSIFVLNTGALDGVADQLWRVICRHMESLIPMAGHNGAQGANQGAGLNRNQEPPPPEAPQQDTGAPNRGNPNPENMAVRLVGQRRAANADWLLDCVRRAERAGLLFLASIAPGVAERHIANLEAEIERQRREAEAAEAARRAAEAEAEAAAGTGIADGAVGEENATGEEGNPAIAGSAPQVNVDEPSPPPEADRQPDLIQV